MKIKGQLYDTMKAAIKAVVAGEGGSQAVLNKWEQHKQKIAESGKAPSQNAMLWLVWHNASQNLMYDDNHPHFQSGRWKRFHPHQPGFNIYSDDTIIDDHILTALKAIGKELKLI